MWKFTQLSIFSIEICIMMACGNAPIKIVPKTTDTNNIQKQVSEQSRSANYRSVLIGELKNLQAVIASNDKKQIGQFFQFPLADSLVSVVFDDPGYKIERRKYKGRITRGMFEKYFSKISLDWQLDEFNKLFQHVNLNDLLLKDSLEFIDIKPNEPCEKLYSLFIHDSLVHIIYGTSANPDYSNKAKPKDDEAGDGCEYSTFWLFDFDGRKLTFRRQLAAG